MNRVVLALALASLFSAGQAFAQINKELGCANSAKSCTMYEQVPGREEIKFEGACNAPPVTLDCKSDSSDMTCTADYEGDCICKNAATTTGTVGIFLQCPNN